MVERQPHLFEGLRYLLQCQSIRDVEFQHTFQYLHYPVEDLVLGELTEQQVDSKLFDIHFAAVPPKIFRWLEQSDATMDDVDVKLLRRVVEMMRQGELLAPGELVLKIARFAVRLARVSFSRAFSVLLSEIYLHPTVQRRHLNAAAQRLLISEGWEAHKGVLLSMRELFACGASPLLRDDAGALMIANMVNGRICFGGAEENVLFSKKGLRQRAMVLINEVTPAKWTRENHALFPSDVRDRIITFVLVNRRFRCQKLPWLPRDPLSIVLKLVAEYDVLNEARVWGAKVLSDVDVIWTEVQMSEAAAIII